MVKSTPGIDSIEDEIRNTRHDIEDKVERLQQRLSPGEMIDGVVEFARANGGAIAGSIGRGLRDNPVPAALIGAGVLWIALSSLARRQDADSLGGRTAERLRHKAADLRESAREQVAAAGEKVREAAGEVGERAQAETARAWRSSGRFAHEHPILVGAAGLALGAAIAASLPRSAREDRAFGARSDRAREAAREAAVKEGRKVQEAAKAAVEKARETAERKAPKADDLKRDVERSVDAAASTKKSPGAAG
jgi:hypothetical protein